jgi:hypothetical protein
LKHFSSFFNLLNSWIERMDGAGESSFSPSGVEVNLVGGGIRANENSAPHAFCKQERNDFCDFWIQK